MESLLKKMDEIGFDALVNNAISMPIAKKHFHRMGLEVLKDGFAQNILPTVEITQRAITKFREKKGGRIVTMLTATLAGRPPAGYSEYTAAKAYLHSLAKSWAAENAVYGITSNSISPGYMATKLTSDTDERIVEQMTSQHPLKRLLTTGEVAEAVEFFLNAPLHVNGTNLLINAASEML
jgi:NAD(P)-dependent dehydrogenase (short-subunit alcohol dehydrogenase family)